MAKRFGESVVKTDREPVLENGQPVRDARNRPKTRAVGTRIEHHGSVYVLPQWPTRVTDVKPLPDGTLAVEFDRGERSRTLDPRFDAIQESAAGGSQGG